jgi:hypothetical protein
VFPLSLSSLPLPSHPKPWLPSPPIHEQIQCRMSTSTYPYRCDIAALNRLQGGTLHSHRIPTQPGSCVPEVNTECIEHAANNAAVCGAMPCADSVAHSRSGGKTKAWGDECPPPNSKPGSHVPCSVPVSCMACICVRSCVRVIQGCRGLRSPSLCILSLMSRAHFSTCIKTWAPD